MGLIKHIVPDDEKKLKEHLSLNGVKIMITAVDSSRGNKKLLHTFYELLPVITTLMTTVVSKMGDLFKEKRV